MAHRHDQGSSNRPTSRSSARPRSGRRRAALLLCAALLGAYSGAFLSACSVIPGLKSLDKSSPAPVLKGDIGTVVTDEPQAALIGHDVLARNGNAADAAVATAIALGVTLPSRASLGGGGACLVSTPDGTARSFSFLSRAGSSSGGDRPAGTPAVLRGLYLMHHQYGSVEFRDLVTPALNLANNGITVSRVLAGDLNVVRSALLADEEARAVFGRGGTGTLEAGDNLAQPRLAGFLEQISAAGVGDLYDGALADIYATAAQKAGGGLNVADLRDTLPAETAALTTGRDGINAAFLAPPADGGLGAAIRYATGASAQGAVAAWRASGATDVAAAQAALDRGKAGGGALPPLPASTSFVVTDRNGMAVACVLSENNLFGTGRIAGSTGVVLAASPKQTPRPLLAAAVLREGGGRSSPLRAVLAASGQNAAADALGDAARAAARGAEPAWTDAARVNAVICAGKGECRGATNPRGDGLAVGVTGQSGR